MRRGLSMKKCNILGVNVNVTNMAETVNYIESNLDGLRGEYICVSNVHTTVMAYEDKFYREIQNSGALVLPDGKPLSMIQKKRLKFFNSHFHFRVMQRSFLSK